MSANSTTIEVVQSFEEAINRHDLEAAMALMTEDCVFETTLPAPDGTRYVGQAAVRAAFAEFFQASPQAVFETEEQFACGDRATVRWLYKWIEADGTHGHVRGVDVVRVRDGRVAESLAYVKG